MFEASYFQRFYGTQHRNPNRKLAWYLSTILASQPNRPIRMLEVGCGLGAFAEYAADTGSFDVVATDVSEYAIGRNADRRPDLAWIRASATDRIAPDESFDVVAAFDILEHLEDPQAAVGNCARMLRPGGVLVAVVPVYDGVSGPVIRRLDKDPTHLHKWARSEWLEVVGSSLEVEHWVGVFRYSFWRFALTFPTQRLRAHAPAILLTGRKREA